MTDNASASRSLLATPLAQWHVEHGGKLTEFAGYQMPVQYGSIVTEHLATRQAAGLFDVSHMARLRFEGPNSTQLLDHLLTRPVHDMRLGQVRYALICNAAGGILDDVLVSYLEAPSGRQFYVMVVNAGNHQKILKWLQPHAADFPDVVLSDVTASTAMMAVQGPKAATILQRLFPEYAKRVVGLRYYRSLVTHQMGKPVIVSRTGYTGEDGFELIVRSESALRVWENLMLAGREHGLLPAGLGARDTLRLEAGMPLYGHELSEEIDPLTAGVGFAVNLDNRSFIGSDALRTLQASGVRQRRVGLQLQGRRAAREGAHVLDADQRIVGRVTSGTFSPTLQRPIAMAYVSAELSAVGSMLSVDVRGSRVEAQVVPLPFYKASS
ncbi:MAG: glycine cleavage system aminomethyltransferase GcvT [Pirellulaceae bacterium]|nr:glycine cleavage system aminomethyltransferase GcvT [Pirellulaceae bacterium]